MRAWMHDAIHVKVQTIEFFAIWVWARGVDRDLDRLAICAGDAPRLFLLNALYDLGVLFREPAEECWHTLVSRGRTMAENAACVLLPSNGRHFRGHRWREPVCLCAPREGVGDERRAAGGCTARHKAVGPAPVARRVRWERRRRPDDNKCAVRRSCTRQGGHTQHGQRRLCASRALRLTSGALCL